jgi:hypothetical protein
MNNSSVARSSLSPPATCAANGSSAVSSPRLKRTVSKMDGFALMNPTNPKRPAGHLSFLPYRSDFLNPPAISDLFRTFSNSLRAPFSPRHLLAQHPIQHHSYLFFRQLRPRPCKAHRHRSQRLTIRENRPTRVCQLDQLEAPTEAPTISPPTPSRQSTLSPPFPI